MTGFGNALVFKSIGRNEIDEIEKYMRNNKSSSFCFRPGDIKLIEALVKHVKKVVDDKGENSGLAHFTFESKVKVQSIANCVDMRDETKTHYLLRKLISAADRNSQREKGGYRYDSDIKLLSSFLRMIAGLMPYEFVQKNLEHCLPSLSSTNRYIQSSGYHVTEGVLRCEELAIYLSERSLEPVVCLSEDATRITGRVQYDSKSNQLIGFVLPLSSGNGVPIPFKYPARNAEEILGHFVSQNSTASFLNVIMAKPIANVPAFCLTVFGSDNKYTAEDVAKRWQYITEQLAKVKIKVLTISSDSDPKYNKAMRLLSELGHKTKNIWFSMRGDRFGPFYIQDTVHVATKLRNFLLRTLYDKRTIPFGDGFIKVGHLYELLNMFLKDEHQLTASTLNPIDRQNFKSVLRICNKRVTDLLRDHIKDSASTIQFLQIIRDIIDSFMDHDLTPLQRTRKMWYSLFLIRIWRQFIISTKGYTLKDNFLSANCYTCIELNAHGLVQSMLHLKEIDKDELFKPYFFESQPRESLFRQLRSMSTVFSTVTNCTVKEALSKISKIHFQNQIMQLTSQFFVYPRLKNSTFPHSNQKLPSKEEIFKEIKFCRTLAIATAKKIGLIEGNVVSVENYECQIKPATPTTTSRLKKKQFIENKIGINSLQLTMCDLKNIKLINYVNKVKPDGIDGNGPYVEIRNSKNKKMLVKKTSLCWLLGNESKKLSSDRLLRVMHTTTNSQDFGMRKKIRNPTLNFAHERINMKRNKKCKRHLHFKKK